MNDENGFCLLQTGLSHLALGIIISKDEDRYTVKGYTPGMPAFALFPRIQSHSSQNF